MVISGRLIVHAPVLQSPLSSANSVDWLLLQRHGMWEFYLGGFLILPERLASAYSCIELIASGGLTVEDVWEMAPMPPSAPVPVAPTYG